MSEDLISLDNIINNDITIYIPIKSILFISGIYDRGKEYLHKRYKIEIYLIDGKDSFDIGFDNVNEAEEWLNFCFTFYNRKS